MNVIGEILKKQLGIKGQIYTAINYLLSESVDNITEHALCERAHIFAQCYPAKGYIDICIADNGITILGSYRRTKRHDIETDLDALKNACKGISTKNRPEAENRGYGIITSKNMLVDGLDGVYFLLSGRGLNIRSKSGDKYGYLPEKISWDGTIVALRIPFGDAHHFNYIDYLE